MHADDAPPPNADLDPSSPADPVPWSPVDFVLVILAGLMGAFAAAAWVLLTAPPADVALVGSTLGMAAGHLLGVHTVLRYRGSSWERLGLDVRPGDGVFLLLGIVLQVVASLVFAPLADLVDSDGTTQVVVEQIAAVDRPWARIAIVVLVALVAPVVEEVVFRGVLQRALLAHWRPVWGVVVTALVFSVFHTLGVDLTNLPAVGLTLVQLFLVGLVLGEVARRQRRLGGAILTHAGFNLIAVLALLFASELL